MILKYNFDQRNDDIFEFEISEDEAFEKVVLSMLHNLIGGDYSTYKILHKNSALDFDAILFNFFEELYPMLKDYYEDDALSEYQSQED